MPTDNDGSLTVDTTEAAIQPVEVTDTSADTSSATDASAPSSSASEGETKESLLDAVLNAHGVKDDPDKLTLHEEAPTSTQPNSEDQTDPEAPEPEVDLDQDPSKDELSRYSSKTRKRIQKLLQERNFAREEAQATKGLKEYLSANDIAKDDFQLTLDLAVSMRRGDYRAFLEGVAPYVQLAQEALGITLPQDLQQQVQQGYMTTDAASRMSQERFGRIRAEQEAQRLAYVQQNQQVSQQQAQHQAQQAQLTQSVEQTVSAWEARVRNSDPDYGRKESVVKDFLWAVVRERGAPQTPQDALSIAEEAYERTNNVFRSMAPAPKATRAVPSSVNRTVGVRPEPKSLMEAAMIGLERARR